MTAESVRKGTLVGLVLLIGVAICALVWFLLHKHKVGLQGQNRPPPSNNEIAAAGTQTFLQPSQKPAENLNEEPLNKKESIAQRASSLFMSSLSEEQLATPTAQKMLEAMNSPEYLDLMGRDFTTREWNDFLESQGVSVTRDYAGLFRKVVPHMDVADYEPVVRRKLAELFVAAEPVDLTNPAASALQRGRVYLEFATADMANAAWFIEKFGEDRDGLFRWKNMEGNPAFIWMTDIQRNAASIVATAKAAEGDAPETQASAPSWDLSSVSDSSRTPVYQDMESPSASQSETEASPSPDTPERASMTDTEIEAVIEKALTAQPSDVLTNQRADTQGEIQGNLEATLREQFSSERFDRAMSTLERYGPEEGLRRLRENDPEIAKRIERHRTRSRSLDSDKSEEGVSQ